MISLYEWFSSMTMTTWSGVGTPLLSRVRSSSASISNRTYFLRRTDRLLVSRRNQECMPEFRDMVCTPEACPCPHFAFWAGLPSGDGTQGKVAGRTQLRVVALTELV